MTALDDLVQRLEDSGHPYPREAAAFMAGDNEQAAAEVLRGFVAPVAWAADGWVSVERDAEASA